MSVEIKWADYRCAIVEIQGPYGPFVVGTHKVLGRRDVPWPTDDDVWWIITAENPNGLVAAHEDNAKCTGALRLDLDRRGWRVLDAIGGDLTWVHIERSFAVLGPTEDEAVALGRKYGQHAIFGRSRDHWTLISCVDDRREEMEWGSIRGSVAQLAELDEPGERS